MLSIPAKKILRRKKAPQQLDLSFNGMHSRSYISADQYWRHYNASKDALVVFSTISAPVGGWHDPFKGEMMTEWGHPGEDCPLLGMHESWEVDSLDPLKRTNLQTAYWLCIPQFDTDF